MKETLKQYMWPGTTKVFFNVRSLWYEEIAPFRKDTIMVLVYSVEYNSDCSFFKNQVSDALKTKLEASSVLPYSKTIKMGDTDETIDLTAIMNNPALADTSEYARVSGNNCPTPELGLYVTSFVNDKLVTQTLTDTQKYFRNNYRTVASSTVWGPIKPHADVNKLSLEAKASWATQSNSVTYTDEAGTITYQLAALAFSPPQDYEIKDRVECLNEEPCFFVKFPDNYQITIGLLSDTTLTYAEMKV